MPAVTIWSDFRAQKIKSATVSTISPSIWHEVMGPDAMILVFECWISSQIFHSPLLSPSSRDSLVPLHFLPLEWYHLHFWGCLSMLCCVCLVTQSCPILWDPMGCSPPGSSVLENSPGKNTRVCCHAVAWRDLPNLAVQPRSPALQVDSLQSEPPGKPYLCCSVYGSSFIFMAH